MGSLNSHRLDRRRLRGRSAVCALGWLLLASVAHAGFIAMETRSEVDVGDGEVVVRVSTTNRGDEPAFQVRFGALHPEEPQSSPTFDRLEVGG